MNPNVLTPPYWKIECAHPQKPCGWMQNLFFDQDPDTFPGICPNCNAPIERSVLQKAGAVVQNAVARNQRYQGMREDV